METVFHVLVVVGILVLGLLVLALMYRPRKGRFRVRGRGSRWLNFRTDFGEFTIDGANGLLIVFTRKARKAVKLADITRLHYSYREKEAPLAEALRGWDIWDLSKEYRDVTGWFQIAAVLTDGERIPIYAIGQYEPKEPWSGRLFALEKGLLAKVGLFHDVEERSRSVLEELRAAFSAAGRPLGLL
jgi:hypothetical protein